MADHHRAGAGRERVAGALDLLDWKRRVFSLYERVRASPDPEDAWRLWRRERDDLFAGHPQSPLPPQRRAGFTGLEYFDYDPAVRAVAEIVDAEPRVYDIATSGPEPYRFERIALARFELYGSRHALEVLWLHGYGGGVFVSFRDRTSGTTTYGACRYLLDTVKGADLGGGDGSLVLDFNFAYNPSCSYDPRWVCPLAVPANRLDIAIEAGERTAA